MDKKHLYQVTAALLCVIAFFIVRKINKSIPPTINLPGIVLKDTDGNKVTLTAFSGKPSVVNFWGSWCGPCRQELPLFEKVKQQYRDKINFIMISDEPLDKIKKFSMENSYTFFYAQSQMRFRDLAITSVPMTYFFDHNARLVYKKKDALNEKELNELIAALTTK